MISGFRMSRASFDSLCDKVREQLQRNARVRYVVSIELLVAVWLELRRAEQLSTLRNSKINGL